MIYTIPHYHHFIRFSVLKILIFLVKTIQRTFDLAYLPGRNMSIDLCDFDYSISAVSAW